MSHTKNPEQTKTTVYPCGCRAKMHNRTQYLFRWTVCKRHHEQLGLLLNVEKTIKKTLSRR